MPCGADYAAGQRRVQGKVSPGPPPHPGPLPEGEGEEGAP